MNNQDPQILWDHQTAARQPAETLPESQSPTSLDIPLLEALIEAYRKQEVQQSSKGETVKVSQALSSLAVVYEKIRNAVDFRAEHLFRRNAIERILRRRWLGRETTRITTSALLKELIWGAYFPNDSIPKTRVEQLNQVLEKYEVLKDSVGKNGSWTEWFLDLAATEIDEVLVGNFANQAWAKATATWVKGHYDWKDPLSTKEKNLLFFAAADRAFLRADDQVLRYHLWLQFFPTWEELKPNELGLITQSLHTVKKEIEEIVAHPLSHQLFRLFRRQTPSLWVLKEVLDRSPSPQALLQDQKTLFVKIRETCQKKYGQTGQKVRQGIVRSIIYILATKAILAVIIELPYERFVGQTSLLPLLINLVFPPFLMFLVGLLIQVPGEKNTNRIIRHVQDFLTSHESEEIKIPLHLLSAKKGRGLTARVFAFFYLLLFVSLFGGISYLLLGLGFTWVSLVIFFFFVSLVLLFGFRVRWTAQELLVVEEKEGIFTSLINILSLPFIDVGARLSRGLMKFNFLTVVLDFIIEAPLKLIIDVIGDFTGFIRKKREEVIEVPM